MRLISRLGAAILTLTCAIAPLAASANSAPVTVSINRVASASISLSRSTFTWASLSDGTNQYMASDAGNTTVTGYIATSGSGSGSVVVSAPANITGTNANVLPISDLAITCAGGVLAGQTFASPNSAMTASASTNCATYAANFHNALNFTIGMFVDDRNLPVDNWTSAGFAVVATAT